MRCGVEIRRQEEDRRGRVVQIAAPPKVQPKKKPACSIRRNAQKNEIKCFEYEGVGH